MQRVFNFAADLDPVAREHLSPVHRGFDVVRQAVVASKSPPEPTEEALYDDYTVADVRRARREDIAPEATLLVNGYWTLGRTMPRHGAPWASVTIDETSGVMYFRVRVGGTFDDVETPPQWFACRVRSDVDAVGEMLMDAGTRDYWWCVDGAEMRIAIVTNDSMV